MFFFKCLFPIGPGTFDTFDAGMGLNLGDDRRDARHSELEKNARARGVRGARVHHRLVVVILAQLALRRRGVADDLAGNLASFCEVEQACLL